MDQFQHKPLQSATSQIRLLRLLNEHDTTQPSYVLDSFDIDQCPVYEALSYTWGPPLPTKTINIDGKSFEIRENLGAFLDQLRNGITILDEQYSPLPNPKYIWIDQICIDQTSQDEKSY